MNDDNQTPPAPEPAVPPVPPQNQPMEPSQPAPEPSSGQAVPPAASAPPAAETAPEQPKKHNLFQKVVHSVGNFFKKIGSSLKKTTQKLGKTPLLIGKRKFITIPVIILALAALIAVPIIIVSNLNSSEPETLAAPEPTAFELIFLRNIIDQANQLAESGDVDGALEALDNAIIEADGSAAKQIYINQEKSALSANYERLETAFDTMLWLIAEAESRNDDQTLRDRWAYMGSLLERMDRKQDAIDAWEKALDYSDIVEDYSGYDYMIDRIEALEQELGQS
jgi:tetratricopeptide (TPR) repeat protein